MKTHFFRTQRLRCGTFFSIHREVFTVLFLLVVLVLVLRGSASASTRHNLKHGSAGQARSQFSYMSGQGYFNYPSSDDNWLGGTGNWTNAALWSAGVPGSSSDVFIGSGGDDRSLYAPSHGTINSLTMGAATGTAEFDELSGAALIVSGTLNNQANGIVSNAGTLSVASLVNLGSLTNQGTLTLTNQPSGITQIAQGSWLDNSGSFLAGGNNAFAQLQDIEGTLMQHNGQATTITPGGGTLTIGPQGFFEMFNGNTMTTVQVNGDLHNNQGVIRTNGGALTVTGAVNNQGALEWFGDGVANVNRLTAMGGLVNTGNTQLQFGGIVSTPHFSNSNYLSIDHTSAFLVGTGTAATGYQQSADGVLTENLSDAFHFGLMFADSFALDGTLDLELQNGFTPQAGSSFIIGYAKAGGVSGQFAHIINQFFNNGTEEWVVNYDNTHGYLELDVMGANAPEPGTLLLLGTSMAGVGVLLRRRLS